MIDNTCQAIRMEPDQGSGHSFALYHVYAEYPNGPRQSDLNQAASFWMVKASDTGRRTTLSYAGAIDARGGKLSFQDFCALAEMREALVALVSA